MQETNNRKHIACLSDIGKKRKNNEDAAYCSSSDNGSFLIVCDGMGGHRKGEVASKGIVDSMAIPFQGLKHPLDVKKARKFCRKYIKKANREIYENSLEGTELKEMGSTCVAAMIVDDGTYILSIGDSRCYTYSHSDGRGLTQRTTDQTYVEMLFEQGKITKSEIANHPQKNLLINAVGITRDLNEIQDHVIDNTSYDTLLLCSDGLYNMVSEKEIADVLKDVSIDVSAKARKLVDLALEHGGNDNIAVALWEK